MRMLPAAALACLLALPAVAAPKKAKQKLLVLDTAAQRGIDESTAKVLDGIVATEFARLGRFDVVTGADIAHILKEVESRKLMGCDTESCYAELGGMVGAQLLAVPGIGRLGDSFHFQLRVIDVNSARVEQRTDEAVRADENVLAAAVRRGIVTMYPPVREGVRPAAWWAAGVAAAAAVAGGGLGWSAWSTWKARDDARVSAPAFRDLQQSGESYALGANIAFGCASAAAVAAVAIALWPPPAD